MNLLDLVIVAYVLAVTVRGYYRGFLRETFGLAGWLLGGVGAVLLARPLTPFASERTGLPPALAEAVAGLAVFAVTLLGFRVLGWLLARGAGALLPAWNDLGAAFGVVASGLKALVACAMILLVFESRRGAPQISERIPGSLLGAPLARFGWEIVGAARERFGEPHDGKNDGAL